MRRQIFTLACLLAVAALLAAAADSACAQGGGGRGGRGGRGFGFGGRGRTIHQIQIAQLPEVQANLKITDEQKTKIADLSDEFDDERRGQFGGGGGGGGGFGGGFSEEARAARAKMNADYAAKLNELLDEAQQKRLQEIYVQVNGTSLLTGDDMIAGELKITDEQKGDLQTALEDQRQAMMDAFQGWQDMTNEERTAKIDELNKARDAALLAVLTDEQKQQFEDMKGEKLEIDMTQLQGGFGGRGGFGGGGRGGPGGGGRGGRGGDGGGRPDGDGA
jgi:Spy/CpxP family protein refolding chaperone